jgi:hypothetical protein
MRIALAPGGPRSRLATRDYSRGARDRARRAQSTKTCSGHGSRHGEPPRLHRALCMTITELALPNSLPKSLPNSLPNCLPNAAGAGGLRLNRLSARPVTALWHVVIRHGLMTLQCGRERRRSTSVRYRSILRSRRGLARAADPTLRFRFSIVATASPGRPRVSLFALVGACRSRGSS